MFHRKRKKKLLVRVVRDRKKYQPNGCQSAVARAYYQTFNE